MKVVPALMVLVLMFAPSSSAQEERVVIVDGVVQDSVTGNPIEGASVSAEVDVWPVLSDGTGRFKLIFLASEPVQIEIHKEGYGLFERIVIPHPKITLDVQLVPLEDRPTIVLESFEREREIHGRVEAIEPAQMQGYKVLVYVLTDKWYIHPYAENREGRGYAAIESDGSWRIRTVFRGYQAYRVAFLLVASDTYAPSSVRVEGSDPSRALLANMVTKASLIIDAPEGI